MMRQQARSVPTELWRGKPNRGDGRLADHLPKPATHVKTDDGSISKTPSHSVAVTTACGELDDDSSLLKKSNHRSNDER